MQKLLETFLPISKALINGVGIINTNATSQENLLLATPKLTSQSESLTGLRDCNSINALRSPSRCISRKAVAPIVIPILRLRDAGVPSGMLTGIDCIESTSTDSITPWQLRVCMTLNYAFLYSRCTPAAVSMVQRATEKLSQ